uniref:Uncharacterized protein n=1 Tax=Zea mays TaxID=4577 RepID=A0A804MY23_MAIZE
MIGVPVPRKPRSASTKRSSHEWPVPGGGTSGGSTGAGDGSQIADSTGLCHGQSLQRQPPLPSRLGRSL